MTSEEYFASSVSEKIDLTSEPVLLSMLFCINLGGGEHLPSILLINEADNIVNMSHIVEIIDHDQFTTSYTFIELKDSVGEPDPVVSHTTLITR